MYNPGVTYRIQFNKDFNFSSFEKIIAYLHQLGIDTIYASPVFEAVPGSTHGYDVTNPNAINPEIGTMEQLETIAIQLQSKDMGWLQDIVPNHMAYDISNQWLADVLANGLASPYASYFDIDWDYYYCPGKIMLPILDKPLEKAIEDNDLKLDMLSGSPVLTYKGTAWPLQRDSLKDVLPEDVQDIENSLSDINNNKKTIRQIADRQYYQLCEWRETDHHINYRRFFTINSMICLNIQDQQVFDSHHALIKRLLQNNIIQGLRIDHIDGLYDPTQYLYRLRALSGADTYITVEKILETGEGLPVYWPVQGTTGYDFIAIAGNLFSNPEGDKRLTAFYHGIVGKKDNADRQMHEKKEMILNAHMHGELERLCLLFENIVQDESNSRSKLKHAIAAFLVYCPLYRYYSAEAPFDEREHSKLKKIFSEIKQTQKKLSLEITLLEHILLELPYIADQHLKGKIAHFFKRCMQLTGPLMAKGVEDTLMYTYNRELAHNEVGDTPGAEASAANGFHKSILKRKINWPYTMNATATHDTKRGEDARARLYALPDIAAEWINSVEQWRQLNEPYRQNGIPDYNEEYFIYQSLAACYPMPDQETDDFDNRFHAYIQKALREAKIHTTWANPDAEYESSVAAFISNILRQETAFMQNFLQIHKKIADAGIVNSLAQLVLKCTCPGVPDIYQGCELWDLSMVDPDNRRPVNYELRTSWLYELASHKDANDLRSLWENRYSGKIKLWLLHRLLAVRNQHQKLFTEGSYEPLSVTGKYKQHILAYMRRIDNECCVVILPLHTGHFDNIIDFDWEDTAIKLTDGMPEKYEAALFPTSVKATLNLTIKDAFGTLPFAILHGYVKQSERSAGILMPLFSLPNPFGIGDFGSSARSFVRFLKQSKQKYWQLLPLNPVHAEGKYSPYSSLSGMACNPLFISPEWLAKERLIEKEEISQYYAKENKKVDYAAASRLKTILIDNAYQNFCNRNYTTLRFAFEDYCQKEHHWLHDYALFMALKSVHNNLPWNQWPAAFKQRDETALARFERSAQNDLHKIKWAQFIAERQWQQVRNYCRDRQISQLGDMPFYVSYDSADVWSHPEYFCLDHDGKMQGIAGVPPDYFSEDGQLWNVPTFNWNKLKESNYSWWINRLRKNITLFDLVRIDHFRAFEAYWQVPSGEKVARNGKWVKGPGIEFFNVVKKELGFLPFVAEDLGEEMEDVYILREKCGLPGMKVLQYAWGSDMRTSVNIPHNYTNNCIVYTGTHDNNTTIGWYKQETKKEDHRRMHAYTGRDIDVSNVHVAMAAITYSSVANTAILPMQDILGLDERSRINTPGTASNNWQWRMPADALSHETIKYLRRLTALYNRR